VYNALLAPSESMRVFPLPNWTELDIWEYILIEDIPIVPLYFAAKRPMVERDGTLIMIDDDRVPLHPGEQPQIALRQVSYLGLLSARRLQAEREHGITIDVAYRFFVTKRRRFVVADTPGPRAVYPEHGHRCLPAGRTAPQKSEAMPLFSQSP
jgi:3'-phosphoadenosine 5'-phosphosulfate sulfotransferase (PAPS reductase)/FAD synthetase